MGADGEIFYMVMPADSSNGLEYPDHPLPISTAAGCLPFSPSRSLIERMVASKFFEDDVRLIYYFLLSFSYFLYIKKAIV